MSEGGQCRVWMCRVNNPAQANKIIKVHRLAVRKRNSQQATATGMAQIVTILASEVSDKTYTIPIRIALQQPRKMVTRTPCEARRKKKGTINKDRNTLAPINT